MLQDDNPKKYEAANFVYFKKAALMNWNDL